MMREKAEIKAAMAKFRSILAIVKQEEARKGTMLELSMIPVLNEVRRGHHDHHGGQLRLRLLGFVGAA